MSGINKIKISNFQSHKNSEITFTEGLNIITGSSDSGKSSILRSLLWVVNNRPSGDSIRNWSMKEKDSVSVSVELDNAVISKERKQGKGIYSLNDTIYEAVKTDVPEEITRAFDLSDINIQNQHDPYFLLNESSGEVARKLNELVGLNVIDILFKNLNSKTLSTKRDIENETKEAERLQTEIDSLSYLDALSRELIKLEVKVEKLEKLDISISSIENSLVQYTDIENKLKEFNELIKHERTMIEIVCQIDEYTKTKNKADEIDTFIADLQEIGRHKEHYAEILKQEKYYTEIKSLLDRFSEVNKLADFLSDQYSIFNGNAKKIKQENINIEKYEKEHKKLLKENGICPLCGATING
jgi:DNA repair protein SbcC/Rad50